MPPGQTPWNNLPTVELLMVLEKIRTTPRTSAGANKIRAALKQAEDAIRAAEKMKQSIRDLLEVQRVLMPGVRYISVPNYAILNDGPINARKALLDYLTAVPERDHEQVSRREAPQGQDDIGRGASDPG